MNFHKIQMKQIKTPEQMAEEYAEDWHKDCDYSEAILKHTKKATETVFLAGYKTAEEKAEKYMEQEEVACDAINHAAEHLVKAGFLAGYQAAKDQFADANKVTTADYVENAINDAKQLIVTYELEGDKDILIKALVAAYCSGVDAVDGYLRNSLSAYRNSVKRLQWISVKERLPEIGEWVLINGPEVCQRIEPPSASWKAEYAWNTDHESFYYPKDITHWMPLPKPPKEEK